MRTIAVYDYSDCNQDELYEVIRTIPQSKDIQVLGVVSEEREKNHGVESVRVPLAMKLAVWLGGEVKLFPSRDALTQYIQENSKQIERVIGAPKNKEEQLAA